MNEQLMQDYTKVTGGIMPQGYVNAEHQGQQIVKFSLFEATNFDYSNVTRLDSGTNEIPGILYR